MVFAGCVSSLSLASFGVANFVVGALIFAVDPSSFVGWIWPLCQNWGFCSISIPRLFAGKTLNKCCMPSLWYWRKIDSNDVSWASWTEVSLQCLRADVGNKFFFF